MISFIDSFHDTLEALFVVSFINTARTNTVVVLTVMQSNEILGITVVVAKDIACEANVVIIIGIGS